MLPALDKHEQAVNSTFEACLARYGGAALFLCGGEILHTKFLENEADGLFGAVVNGDLSDEQKENASVALGSTAGTNYTCPLLKISLSSFHDNLALNGYGGAVASVDAKLSVWNSTMTGTTGGALYFGTSNEEDRNQIDVSMETPSVGGKLMIYAENVMSIGRRLRVRGHRWRSDE